jgi:hypothetical protein
VETALRVRAWNTKVALIEIAQAHKEERNYKLEQLNESYLRHPVFIPKLILCVV